MKWDGFCNKLAELTHRGSGSDCKSSVIRLQYSALRVTEDRRSVPTGAGVRVPIWLRFNSDKVILFQKREHMYIINKTKFPYSCLPENIDETELIDITPVNSVWRKYQDPKTDKIHDCEEYYNMSRLAQW